MTTLAQFLSDLRSDAEYVLADLAGALVRFAVAAWFLLYVAQLEYNAAIGTAALLGATGFFETRRASRAADDIRALRRRGGEQS